jgi:hypothetical protein
VLGRSRQDHPVGQPPRPLADPAAPSSKELTMKRAWTILFIMFLIGVFLTVGGQPTEPLAQSIGEGVEGGLSFLGDVFRALTN